MQHLGTTALVRLRARARASCLLQRLSVRCIPGPSATSLCEGCVSARDRSLRRALACPPPAAAPPSPKPSKMRAKSKLNSSLALELGMAHPARHKVAGPSCTLALHSGQAGRLLCIVRSANARLDRPTACPLLFCSKVGNRLCLGGPSRLCLLISTRSHGNFCSPL